jgi:hypothetical protein
MRIRHSLKESANGLAIITSIPALIVLAGNLERGTYGRGFWIALSTIAIGYGIADRWLLTGVILFWLSIRFLIWFAMSGSLAALASVAASTVLLIALLRFQPPHWGRGRPEE